MTVNPPTTRKYLENRYEQLKTDRSSWESEWRDVQQYILPECGRWFTTETNDGKKRPRKIYDGTAKYAMRTLASGLRSGITSPARPWFKLTTPDPDLMEFGAVKVWMELVEERMREMFANSNLYNALYSQYLELGGFGTSAMMIYEDRQDIIRAYGMTCGEYFLSSDDRGEVDTVIREMQWTVGQLVNRFGREKCSQAVQNLFDRGRLNSPVTIRHCIEPNTLYRPGLFGVAGKPWRSVWWEEGSNKDDILGEFGFDSKPFVAPRWNTIGMDVYGRGHPGSEILGDTISLQSMTKKKGRAVDKHVDPAMNLPGSMKNNGAGGYSIDPGAINYIDGMASGITATPAQSIQPNLAHFVADIQEIQKRIEHGAYKDLFLMMHQMDRAQITATEIIERKAEKLVGLGPIVERMNDELLEPVIDRAFELMMNIKDENGMPTLVPPPPDELQDVKLGVQFMSIFRQAQEQEEVTRTVGYVRNLALMAEATQDPSVLDNLDADEAAKVFGNKGGAPARIVASKEAVEKKRQARAEAVQQQMQMAQAGQAVEAAKTLSETNIDQNKNALAQMMDL